MEQNVSSHDSQNSPDLAGKRKVLAIMAKYWTPGKVKTRLGKTIGMDRSAKIHQLFVQHLVQQFSGDEFESWMVATPDSALEAFRSELPPHWSLKPQADGDLGKRMAAWFEYCISQQASGVLIGADCPALSTAEVDVAFEHLGDHDVVLGPAVDGGYYLIGLRAPAKPDYSDLWREISWSTETVFQSTLSRAEDMGLSVAILPAREDVDTETELEHLCQQLANSTSSADKSLLDSIHQILKAA